MAGKTLAVTDEDFEQQVLKSDKLVMVEYWAPWCMPCRAIAPILEELAGEYAEQVVVAKVNMDENPRYAMEYGVMAIPNMMFFKNGEMVDQIVGAGPKSIYKSRLETLLADGVATNS